VRGRGDGGISGVGFEEVGGWMWNEIDYKLSLEYVLFWGLILFRR